MYYGHIERQLNFRELKLFIFEHTFETVIFFVLPAKTFHFLVVFQPLLQILMVDIEVSDHFVSILIDFVKGLVDGLQSQC